MKNQFMANQNISVDEADKREKGFLEKVKDHKKEIAIGAAVMFSMVVIVVVVKNKSAFISTSHSPGNNDILKNSLETRDVAGLSDSGSVSKGIPNKLQNIKVKEHIRSLPDGWNPSSKKIELAEKRGLFLTENQTVVNAYSKVSA